ncbi:hypothetical protein GUJ93_ZPchr0012g21696 [Zizania palustris]|uniref:Uncharacterized protein n=1 Tax=Zizania palustris TaxID=103762 RepID=A0A8J5WM37_ZIZPA|nr:hypothetical protein GUJ93_ZPchr0012g21696 [Zizania palustris]
MTSSVLLTLAAAELTSVRTATEDLVVHVAFYFANALARRPLACGSGALSSTALDARVASDELTDTRPYSKFVHN